MQHCKRELEKLACSRRQEKDEIVKEEARKNLSITVSGMAEEVEPPDHGRWGPLHPEI
jgi:hypothetical protein